MELDGASELNDDTEAAYKVQLARVCADIALRRATERAR
jgi:hypothetical protein